MEPMSELDKLKGLQASFSGLDLNNFTARDNALALVCEIESSLGRIRSAEEEQRWLEVEAEMDRSILKIQELGRQIQGKNALQIEAELMTQSIITADARNLATLAPVEEEAFDEIEAQAIERAHPTTFNMPDFAATVCGMRKPA